MHIFLLYTTDIWCTHESRERHGGPFSSIEGAIKYAKKKDLIEDCDVVIITKEEVDVVDSEETVLNTQNERDAKTLYVWDNWQDAGFSQHRYGKRLDEEVYLFRQFDFENYSINLVDYPDAETFIETVWDNDEFWIEDEIDLQEFSEESFPHGWEIMAQFHIASYIAKELNEPQPEEFE